MLTTAVLSVTRQRGISGGKEKAMIGRLNHVAIAVPDLALAIAQYRDGLGAEVGPPQDLPDHGVTVVFITLANTKIELLHPFGDASPIAGFLDKNPAGGIHHICYEVDDLQAARDHLQKAARGFWGTARPRSARMASPCCSCIRKISTAV
jgi:methylmalonyl-CoA/ethylmalonyl-CoA epimerase